MLGYKKYICMKCYHVFESVPAVAKCCGIIEELNPEKHIDLLIPLSNSWITVYNMWNKDEYFEKISRKAHNKGHYSAGRIMNMFIEKLMKHKIEKRLDKKARNGRIIYSPSDISEARSKEIHDAVEKALKETEE